MVPLEKVLRRPPEQVEPIYVPPPRLPRRVESPEPRRPRLFKVVDISTRQVLSEGVGVGAVVEVLSGVRSIVDVNVYVWQAKAEKWRRLTFHEQRLLWDHRGDAGRPAGVTT